MKIKQVMPCLSVLLTTVHELSAEEEHDYVSANDAVAAAKLMKLYQDANEQADEIKKTIGAIYDYIRLVLLPEKMDQEGIDSPFNVAEVGRIVLTSDVRVSVLDKDAEYDWLEFNGHGDLITQTVNAASLSALVRRYLREGKTVPESVFKVTPFTRASITGGKK
jgi:hypothetical protein